VIEAYILINTEIVDPVIVAKELTNLDEVENVHQVVGEYDLIARVNVEDVITLKEVTLPKITALRGVTLASTLIVETHTLK